MPIRGKRDGLAFYTFEPTGVVADNVAFVHQHVVALTERDHFHSAFYAAH